MKSAAALRPTMPELALVQAVPETESQRVAESTYTEKVLALHANLGTWRRVAECIGVGSNSLWCQVAHGQRRVTRRYEPALRAALGLAPLRKRPSGSARAKEARVKRIVQGMELEALREAAQRLLGRRNGHE